MAEKAGDHLATTPPMEIGAVGVGAEGVRVQLLG